MAEPLNKDAEVLIKWSRTSFFGGGPVSKPLVIEGREYALFQKCSEEWTVRYALASAASNYRFVRLTERGKLIDIDPFMKGSSRPSGGLLGDAATMDRSGGMC